MENKIRNVRNSFWTAYRRKILWIVCKCCGTKIRPHIHKFVRPIDMSDCINCKSDVDKKIKYKGWDYINTKLNAIRYFEKLKDGYWIRDYQ